MKRDLNLKIKPEKNRNRTHRQLFVLDESKLALFWSPKSGCTFAVKWYLSQRCLLDEALDYHPFVHQYRYNVLQKSDYHIRSQANYIKSPGKYTSIKIVRNSFERAVGSYVHVNKTHLLDQEISQFLGRRVDAKNRFSFREFLYFLETLDIYDCNGHIATQINPLEQSKRIRIDKVIHLRNSIEEIKKLEIEHSLKQTASKELVVSKHHSDRFDANGFVGDEKFLIARSTPKAPNFASFYDDEIRALVAKIYADEIERYQFVFEGTRRAQSRFDVN